MGWSLCAYYYFCYFMHKPEQSQDQQFSSQLELGVKHRQVEGFEVASAELLQDCSGYKSGENKQDNVRRIL